MVPLWLDTTPNKWLQSFASPQLTSAMNVISALGYTRVFLALAVLIAFLHNLRVGASLLLLVALTAALTSGAKLAAAMPRPDAVDSGVQALAVIPFRDAEAEPATPSPDDDDAFGFPSGHMAVTTAFMLGLTLLAGWRRPWAWAIVVLMMALSRMYLGAHVLADVIGGVAVAAVATAFVVRLRLWKLEVPDRRRWTIWRVAGFGVAAVVLALAVGLPPAYDAGRFAGFAAAMVTLSATGRIGTTPAGYAAVRCVVLAAIVFAAAWWVTGAVLTELGAARSVGGRLLAGALPAFVLLPGALYLDSGITGIARALRSARAAADGSRRRPSSYGLR
jgi:membrane-associated phospholipid phosphatase